MISHNQSRRSQSLHGVASLALILAASQPAAADDDHRWSFRAGISYTDVGGHDPHILTIADAAGAGEEDLETQSDAGRYLGIGYNRGGKWSYGAGFFFFTGQQELTVPTAARSDGGPVPGYTITEREVRSLTPQSVLFFEQLGDTDMNAWTFDLFARRVLSSSDRGTLRLLFGVRNADFDNDNHLAVGIVDVGGSRIDASSNYSRMIGPLVGLVYDRGHGRHRFRLAVNASVVSGDAELSARLSDFLGPFSDGSENTVASRTFQQPESVSIPIADLIAEWRYNRGGRWTWIAGAHFAHWSGVGVPPGVRPTGSLETLYESSITLSGLVTGVEVGF